MRPSEVFDRSRAAAKRLRRIKEDEQELNDRIGPQGHSYERAPKNDIRDPMRHVDEMLDGTMELEREKVELMVDIRAAQVLIWGMGSGDGVAAMGDGQYVMTEYYVYGKDMREIADGAGMTTKVCELLIGECVRYCDEIGIAKLKGRTDYE